MLKETETEATICFLSHFLSLAALQLRAPLATPMILKHAFGDLIILQ